jgi:hypothetical protein
MDGTVYLFSGMFLCGLLCLAGGLVSGDRFLIGAAIGCIPTGALGVALPLAVLRKRRRVDPDDERLRFIHQRAAYSTLLILFGYMGLYTMLSNLAFVQGISHTAFGSITLGVMTVAYWTAIAIYSRIY